MAGKSVPVNQSHTSWPWLLLVVAALFLLLPQVSVFRQSLSLLSRAQLLPLLMAACFTALTYLVAATTYCLLAFKRLRYSLTVLVQLAGSSANRLLPAGIGGIGASYAYLRQTRQSVAQSAATVAVNNMLGFVGHGLLVGTLLLGQHNHLNSLQLPHHVRPSLLEAGLAGMAVVSWTIARRLRQRLLSNLHRVLQQLTAYRRHPLRVSGALLTSVCLTLCNLLSFYYSTRAVGIAVPFVAAALIFTVGIGAGAVTPTPGGLGGVEAGLVVGLVAYHVASANALAAALIYRFISYWLTLGIGALAFIAAERQGLFRAPS